VIVLFGPTALGKTAIAVEFAERLGAEIVTADSMQVYAGLPVLTNQPTADQAARVPHHLTGFVAPQDDFSAATYAELAHDAIDGLLSRGRRVVLEGGSGLYVRAALGGLHFGPAPDPAVRAGLELRLDREGVGALAAELRTLAPELAGTVDLANPRRVLRALEAVAAGRGSGLAAAGLGRPAAAGRAEELWAPGSRYRHALVALTADRELLRRRIDERVDRMIADGALDELRVVRAAGPLSRTLQQAIGVRELSACLDGALSIGEAAAQIKQRTRRLARRQLTWMRKLPDAATIAVTGGSPGAVADRLATLLDT
jgi:tRNA dimethylallyltransferase